MEGSEHVKAKEDDEADEPTPDRPIPGGGGHSARSLGPLPSQSCEDEGGDGSSCHRRANADSQAPKEVDVKIKNDFDAMLSDLGLTEFYPQKLTLSSVLKITRASIFRKKPTSLNEIPMHFLYNVMRANVKSRNTEYSLSEGTTPIYRSYANDEEEFSLGSVIDPEVYSVTILDLITAVFLCSDSLLQQTLMVKMSLCQFALPLLLPDVSQGSITFLLWAMRAVIHKWRPHSKEESKGYIEHAMVTTAMPMISFVRIGECGVSKSSIINSIVCKEPHNFFVHRDMECGKFPRRISNGLVEVCFHLPCGKSTIDVFPEIFTVANLRGDVRNSPAQFQFLKLNSAAVFIVVDNIGERDCDFLTSSFDPNSNVFLVINPDVEHRSQTEGSVRRILTELKLKNQNVHIWGNQNQTVFLKNINGSIDGVLRYNKVSKNLENMSQTDPKLCIMTDEVCSDCQASATVADWIVSEIEMKDKESVKATLLTAQGFFWQEWSRKDKEMNRLRHRGDVDINEYIAQLSEHKIQIRNEQAKVELPDVVDSFISACFEFSVDKKVLFLQRMKMKLDVLSSNIIVPLEEKFKELCIDPNHHKEALKQTNAKIANSPVGLEHFMRELGQIYEASKASRSNPQFLRLPSVMAQLLINGFPMELLDGDAGCIPIDWVTDVLAEVRTQLGRDPRVFIVSVLGLQSSGKSTLLNVMFGLQFAVGSGRCTRGAFMQLLHVDDNFQRELCFDFLLVIDTEGLKAPQLANLDDSCERDNELATVVIALSDVAIVNLATENAEEMKDVLQVVVHSFLRMREAGKKPHCLFVHQNFNSVSAMGKTLNDQKHLLDQLDRMTNAAAKMEHKDMYYNKFTDVIAHDLNKDNWFIPGLWFGCSAMSPVSYGYTEQVFQLKAHIFEEKLKLKKPCSLTEFGQWVSTVWDSVKKETFIFSFRNILVIEAYSNLCTTYADWEWKFRSKLLSWTQLAQNTIMNAVPDKLHDVHERLQQKGREEVDNHKTLLLQHIENFFSKPSEDAHLIVKYKEDFNISTKHLAKQILTEALDKCEETVCKRKCLLALETLQGQYRNTISQSVNDLLEKCKFGKANLTDEEIEKEFEDVWSRTVSKLPKESIRRRNVQKDMEQQLCHNTQRHKALVNEKLRDPSILCMEKHNFQVKNEHIAGWIMKMGSSLQISHIPSELYDLSYNIIKECKDLIETKKKSNNDYLPTYWDELFTIVDYQLQRGSEQNIPFGKHFVVDIKIHICAIAIGPFIDQHEEFVEQNNPWNQLPSMKEKYHSVFAEMYNTGDEMRNIAMVFCDQCLKPALKEVIDQELGPKIVEYIKIKCITLSNRKNLQHSLLSDLLERDNFDLYHRFLNDYKKFTTTWIREHVVSYCEQNREDIFYLTKSILFEKSERAKRVVSSLLRESTPVKVSDLLQKLKLSLAGDIVMATYALDIIGPFMLQDSNSAKRFCESLDGGVDRVSREVAIDFEKSYDIEGKLDRLTVRPHGELFKLLAGCGNACPLCKAPCDQSGGEHREHRATLHYPQGLCGQKWDSCNKLSVEVCTTSVAKRFLFFFKVHKFSNGDTNRKIVRYADYRTVNKYYGSWNIPESSTLEAPLFWRFVFCKFNEQFAERAVAQPADIPRGWKYITKEQVERDLQRMYGLVVIDE
ncbi:interferon-induced very large GTPase 1-like [Lampetra fluviatilis]